MAVDASWPLQRAIVGKLRSDDLVAALFARVCAPSGTTAAPREPCGEVLHYRRVAARAWHSATFDGQEHDIELELRGRVDGPAMSELCHAIVGVLHDADLALPGHALIELEFICSEVREDVTPGESSGRLVFRALTVSD